MRPRVQALASVVTVIACLGSAIAGQARELEPEFTVSAAVEQYALAADDRESFLVAWTEAAGGLKRLFARLYSLANRRWAGAPVSLGRAHDGQAEFLTVTAVGRSTYIVAWSRLAGASERIVARRVGARGMGGTRDLGAAPTGVGAGLATAGLDAGAWASAVTYPRATAGFGFGGILLTLHAPSGVPERGFRVTRSGFAPALSSDGTGRLLVAYRSARPGEPETVRCQLVGAAGQEAAVDVTSTDFDISSSPSVVASGHGRFVVGWIEEQTLRLRFFESPMRAVGGPLNTGAEGSSATLAMDPGGLLFAAFSLASEFDERPILAQSFDRDGASTSDEFQIATGNGPPVAAALGNRRAVVAYRQGEALRARFVRW